MPLSHVASQTRSELRQLAYHVSAAFIVCAALAAPAIAGTAGNTVACLDDETGSYHDGDVTMTGTGSPNPAGPGETIALQGTEWSFTMPDDLLVELYVLSLGTVVGNGANSFPASISFSIEAPGTEEAVLFDGSSETLTFFVSDPDSIPNGNETAIVDPIVVTLPDSFWTTTGVDAEFVHGDVSIFITTPISFPDLTVDCESGTSDPGGGSSTPSPAPAFEIVDVELPAPTVTAFTCYESQLAETYSASIGLGGVASPDPVAFGVPVDLEYVNLSATLPTSFLVDVEAAGFLPAGPYDLTIDVVQTVEAVGAAEISTSLAGATTSSLVVAVDHGTPIFTGGSFELPLSDTVWTPTGGGIDFTQGALTIEVGGALRDFLLDCTPVATPPPPFAQVTLTTEGGASNANACGGNPLAAFRWYDTSLWLNGLSTPKPAQVGQPLQLSEVELSVEPPGELLVLLGALYGLGPVSIPVDLTLTVLASNTLEGSAVVAVSSTLMATVNDLNANPDTSVTSLPISATFPATLWTPTGGPIEFTQGSVQAELALLGGDEVVTCWPGASTANNSSFSPVAPQPFDTVWAPFGGVPSLTEWGLIALAFGLLASGASYRAVRLKTRRS
jgi:hypothetical protein